MQKESCRAAALRQPAPNLHRTYTGPTQVLHRCWTGGRGTTYPGNVVGDSAPASHSRNGVSCAGSEGKDGRRRQRVWQRQNSSRRPSFPFVSNGGAHHSAADDRRRRNPLLVRACSEAAEPPPLHVAPRDTCLQLFANTRVMVVPSS